MSSPRTVRSRSKDGRTLAFTIVPTAPSMEWERRFLALFAECWHENDNTPGAHDAEGAAEPADDGGDSKERDDASTIARPVS